MSPGMMHQNPLLRREAGRWTPIGPKGAPARLKRRLLGGLRPRPRKNSPTRPKQLHPPGACPAVQSSVRCNC